jgi:nitrous oxidase accessory protein NosD
MRKKGILIFSVCLLLVVGLGGFPSAQRLPSPPEELLYPLSVCPEGPPQCDFATIQAAIEAAAPGTLILIYPGTYRENLTITKSLQLEATEEGQIRIQGVEAGEPILALQVDGKMNILLEGLNILGLTNPSQLARGSATFSTGVEIRGQGRLILNTIGVQVANTYYGVICRSPQLLSVEISMYRSRLSANAVAFECGSTGEETSTLQIEDSLFSGNVGGVYVSGNVRLLIERSFFARNGNAVGADGQVQVRVLQSRFLNNVANGINIKGEEGSHLEIHESLFWGDGIGVNVQDRATLEAYDNQFRGFQYYGLRMMLGTQVHLEENAFEENANGIGIFSGGYLEEEHSLLEAYGNHFIGNEGCGIKIESIEAALKALEIETEGNEFSGNGQNLCPETFPWPGDLQRSRS